MDKFTLQHVVLYSKGWYTTTNIWADMKACLSADRYSSDLMSNKDITQVILGQFERLCNTNVNKLSVFIDAIQECNCYRYGYYTKNNVFNIKTETVYDLNESIVDRKSVV
jgi:hypothetical protein